MRTIRFANQPNDMQQAGEWEGVDIRLHFAKKPNQQQQRRRQQQGSRSRIFYF